MSVVINPDSPTTYLPDGRAPKHGETFRNPALAATLGSNRHRWPRRLLPRRNRPRDRRLHARRRWLPSLRRPGRTPIGMGRAGQRRISRLRCLGAAAQWPGHRAPSKCCSCSKGLTCAKPASAAPIICTAFIEAKKLAFEDRARFYADPAFDKLPIAELISTAYADKRRALIDPTHAATKLTAGNPAISIGDTIYLTTADKDHNMVSLIQSNFRGFGSGLCPPKLGFCLQNRGELFDLTPGRPNSYAPAKRPFHTIIPAFVTKDGKPVMSFGVMGGDMQPQGHVQILINLFDFDMGLQEAGDAPRVKHIGSSEPTGKPAESRRRRGAARIRLRARNDPRTEATWPSHRESDGDFGGYQAIWYDADKDVYFGATESRKDGIALGY